MYKIITKTVNKNKFNSKLISNKEIKKIINDAIIDDKEEYFDTKTTKTQDIQKNSPSLKDNANSIPK